MPYKDPDKQRAAQHRSYERNKAAITDRQRERRAEPNIPLSNAMAQQKARARMSQVQLETGHTEEWWDANHAAMRARVRARYGLDEAA